MKKILYLIICILSSVIIFNNSVSAGVNDFIIKDFHADYYLDKDSEGHSVLKTVELITAEFPEYDQNHGIERAIPKKYDGHSVNLVINSVTDENNINLKYTTYSSNDNLVIRIGDADLYVHGLVTYKITYTQKDVTRFFADTKSDEFYWDVNGVGWSQPFEKVSARIYISESLQGLLNGNQSCYYGAYGDDNQCQLTRSGNEFYAEVLGLRTGENVSFAIGFNEGTFAAYEKTFLEKLYVILADLFVVFSGLCLLIFALLLLIQIIFKIKYRNQRAKKGIIIPQYLPPKDVDVFSSSVVISKIHTCISAVYIDLAVRHNIRIIERKTGLFNNAYIYYLELLSVVGLSSNESALLKSIFGRDLTIGAKYKINLKKPDYDTAEEIRSLYNAVKIRLKNSSYYIFDGVLQKKMKIVHNISIVLLMLNILGIFVFGGDANISSFTVYAVTVGVIVTVILVVLSVTNYYLSQSGQELADYLDGIKMYIKIAEEDRIKILQSPRGAEKVAIDVNDSSVMVKLYERILPYAVLFGIEKEWVKNLGSIYDHSSTKPDWYDGGDTFKVAMLSSALSNFSSSAVRNSYATPSSSSSSGGSSGGGFSGGGGGGGGGGGW